MLKPLPKPAVVAFLFTAMIYLISLFVSGYPLTTVLKVIPLFCLIIGILQSGVNSRVKALLVVALCFSIGGDIALTLPIQLSLELGIVFFLITHLFYIGLFSKHLKIRIRSLLSYLPVFLFSVWYFHFLYPYLGQVLVPVSIYFFVLSVMVFCAFQIVVQPYIIAAGACFFLISDTVLAANLFANQHMDMQLVIMSTYYLAQFLLTLGLVKIAKVNTP